VASAQSETLLIHAGTLLSAPPAPPAKEQTIVITDGKIERIENGYLSSVDTSARAGEIPRIIDLSDRFVLPGLFDGHVHLGFQSGGNPLLGFRQSDSEQALTAMIFARRTLAAGFTTVRDLASGPETMYAVRNAINTGRYMGPRILVSGPPITARGGHGDYPGLRDDVWSNIELRQSGVCWDEGSCRDAVRGLIRRGSDVIKLMATGGFSSGTGPGQQLTYEEMKAAINAAHMRDVRVTTHAYDTSAIRDAVRAGVDSVEHGLGLDREVARLMARQGTYFVPTLLGYQPLHIDPARLNQAVLAQSQSAFKTARKAGVRIAFGTDAGGAIAHGKNGHEFERMVALGMTPMEAITAATVTAAEMFGMLAESGTLEPGKRADVIAVSGNPLDDVIALTTVEFVMIGGKVAKQSGVMRPGEDWADPFAHP